MIKVVEEEVFEMTAPSVVQSNVSRLGHYVNPVQQYPEPHFLCNAVSPMTSGHSRQDTDARG